MNQMVYIHFNEPVIPPLVQTQDCSTADSDNEAQLVNSTKVKDSCLTMHVPGKWKVGINGYKTIQFISSTPCEGVEKNSCGKPVYCLPANSVLVGKALAAKIDGVVAIIGTGLMDMGANSLDGNANGKAEGPGDINASPDNQAAMLDNYFWDFPTGTALDLTPPWLVSLEPNNNAMSIKDVNIILKAFMSEKVDAYTVDTEVQLKGYNSDGKPFDSWFDPNLGKESVTEKVDNKDVTTEKAAEDEIWLSHGPFDEYVEGAASPLYTPVISSEVQDTRQNCFSPTKDKGGGAVLNSDCGSIANPGVSCCPQESENYKLKAIAAEECVAPEVVPVKE